MDAGLTDAGVDQAGDGDEPLFGGTTFRDAHDATAHGTPDSQSYYALLNIDKNAREGQVRDAYKTLAMAFHPDKHADPERKELAEQTFQEIQRAYEVLSNPEKRAVYDHFGAEGLQTSWSVSMRGQTPQEMQAEFERQARLRREADAESLVKSRGDFTAMINASALFVPATQSMSPIRMQRAPLSFTERLQRVSCAQLVGKHGFDMQVSGRSVVSLSGQMLSRGNLGGGNLMGAVKTQWSPRFFSEMSATLLRPHVLTAKGQYAIDENIFFTYAIVSQTMAAPPSVTLTWGQRLSASSPLTGFTSIKTGSYTIGHWGAAPNGTPLRPDSAALVVGVAKHHHAGAGWTWQCTMAELDQALSLDWTTRVFGSTTVKSGVSLGTATGISAYTSGERRVTENVRVLLGVECGLVSGVLLRVRIVRLGQRVVFPIVLSPSFRADLAAGATLLPAAAIALSHYLYFLPKRRRTVAARLEELRRDNAGAIEQRYVSAEQTRALLWPQAQKRAESEAARDGLVIVQGCYGRRDMFPPPLQLPDEVAADKTRLIAYLKELHLPSSPAPADYQPMWWDVRVLLQMLVTQSQLIIPAGRSKARFALCAVADIQSKLIGFFDPCIGERKHLMVRYVFRGAMHELVVDNEGAVAAPLRSQHV
ncbi:hypothetical protein MSPP1_001625 [Malassezia sp. CBS 17886]|nr:hypothetical protein MSPP1_001625 [Malassezia sp. CBS 17886]